MHARFTSRIPAVALLLALMVVFAPACRTARSVDLVAKSEISGTVNGSAFEARVVADINTARGGHSTCEFQRLPPTFNPGTLNTFT